LKIAENKSDLIWVQNFIKVIQKPLDSQQRYAVGLVLFSDQDEWFGMFVFQPVSIQMFKETMLLPVERFPKHLMSIIHIKNQTSTSIRPTKYFVKTKLNIVLC